MRLLAAILSFLAWTTAAAQPLPSWNVHAPLRREVRWRRVFLPFLSMLPFACAQIMPPSTPPTLGGTSWQLVKFQGGDGAVLTPEDRSKYTLAFDPDGVVSARIDCNRARGGWKSAGPNQLEFGPMAATRAQCPPGSLHDHIVRQLPHVRSYVMKNGHLFLSLMADGGIYEFEPVR